MLRWLATTALLCALSPAVNAQGDTQQRLDKLEAELAEMKKQKSSTTDFDDIWKKMHFHGYGDVSYSNGGVDSTAQRGDDIFNVHHLVFGMEYEFREDLRFDFELDFEDGGDEVEVEYAQLEYDLCSEMSVRAGSLLMPVGRLNERHEPVNYYSVQRPYVERSIIPTTWQEVGVGISGRSEGIQYRAVIVNGLDAQDFTAEDGLRDGRQAGIEATGEDIAVAARLEGNIGDTGLRLGASGYYGGADQDVTGLGRVTVGIAEADAQWRGGDFELIGSATMVHVSNTENIFAVTGESIGERMRGWYGEAAYHFMPMINPESKSDLVVFLRREEFDTNFDVANTVPQDLTADRRLWSTGVAYFPIRNVALKGDAEIWKDEAGNSVSRFNVGVAWEF